MLAGIDGTFPSWITVPFRVTTHTCVSSIETSRPAKYSIFGLLFQKTEPSLSASGEEPPTIEKRSGGRGVGAGLNLVFRADQCGSLSFRWRRPPVSLDKAG